MFFLGLTGDIACGKSTVARWLVERGAAHIDADLLVRELYADPIFARGLRTQLQQPRDFDSANDENRNQNSGEDRVLDVASNEVGRDLIDCNGAIDRAVLARWVLGDQKRLRLLEKIVHPVVEKLRAQKIEMLRASISPPKVVVLEAVKLVESGQVALCGAVWWITATREIQMQRLTKDRGLTLEQANLRLEYQPNAAAKRALMRNFNSPLHLIDNSASLRVLEVTLEGQFQALCK